MFQKQNTRHYGAPENRTPSEAVAERGEDQAKPWRIAYDTAPPLLALAI